MNYGDLILVKYENGDGFLESAISRITKSPYCHVAGVVGPNRLIEAQGFRKTGYQALDVYTGHCDLFTCPDASIDQRISIIKFVQSQIGSRYNYGLIVWELLRYMVHINLPFEERHHFICSTLWVMAYRAAGIDLCPGIRYPTPADIGVSKKLFIDNQQQIIPQNDNWMYNDLVFNQ